MFSMWFEWFEQQTEAMQLSYYCFEEYETAKKSMRFSQTKQINRIFQKTIIVNTCAINNRQIYECMGSK